jgi:hypothetical protein
MILCPVTGLCGSSLTIASQLPDVTLNGNVDTGFRPGKHIGDLIILRVRLEVLEEDLDLTHLKAGSFQTKSELDFFECF